MSEQELDEIVQITVEDFNQDDRTGKIPVKLWKKIFFYPFLSVCSELLDDDILCSFNKIWFM